MMRITASRMEAHRHPRQYLIMRPTPSPRFFSEARSQMIHGLRNRINHRRGSTSVIAEYHTNLYDDSPKAWSSGCSGLSVSPTIKKATSSSKVTITMPFNDVSGQPVKYVLFGTNTGSWGHEVQTYDMPTRNAFGLTQTNEIFTNETAKDGNFRFGLIRRSSLAQPVRA